nr:DNA-3-methyladenine glycosylase 2 family protein [Microbacterium barkeri]
MTLTADPASADAAAAGAPRETVYRPPHPLDLRRTVGMLRRGGTDPTMVIDGPVIWRTMRTALGPATLALRMTGAEVRATAWGRGAELALDRVPDLCGARDDDEGFDASRHPLIADSARRNPGLRLTRGGEVFDALACAIIEQKVTGMQAFGAWRWLVSRYGERAPGPTPRPLFAAPSPQQWFRIPSWAWHRAVRRVRRRRSGDVAGGALHAGRSFVPPSAATASPVPSMRRRTASIATGCSRACPAWASGHRPRPASAPSATRMR